jgi:diguanylate cyclase
MQKSDRLSDNDLLLLEAEIDEILGTTPQAARELLTRIVTQNSDQLASHFYDVMIVYPQGDVFLANDKVHERLHSAMKGWLLELFSATIRSGAHIRRHQMEVGAVHARVKVPVSLVMRGFREIKSSIMTLLLTSDGSSETLPRSINLMTRLLDVALAMMTTAYVRYAERATRSDEALRLFSIGLDLAAERERQRASILQWTQQVFYEALLPGRDRLIQALGRSEFGLWFTHRAEILFGTLEEYNTASELIERCDDLIDNMNYDIQADRLEIVRAIKTEADRLGVLLLLMFDHAIGRNSAHDPLTKLLNRQYLTSAVSREIGLTQHGKPAFCLVTFHFDRMDPRRPRIDQHSWDEIFRRSAQIVLSMSRSSDSAFKLNDDTILVVRVECNAEEARLFSDEVALRINSSHFSANDQTVHDLTLECRIVEYDGHPDPRYVIRKAELQLNDMDNAS